MLEDVQRLTKAEIEELVGDAEAQLREVENGPLVPPEHREQYRQAGLLAVRILATALHGITPEPMCARCGGTSWVMNGFVNVPCPMCSTV